ncbi:MAG TPA: class I poly(R)-hydroxyalkanoic acid synthase [Xanthobacteraceae bacterium]|nr:class I poly(R)-hydroxyalkanoic acid synthase [Xanthobacteraceae bacterium]
MEHKKDQETPRAPAPALDPDAFARNLALLVEESGKAMAAYLKPREDGKAREQMAEDIADVVKTLSQVGEYWMADPQRTLEAQASLFKGYMDLWAQTMRRMSGEPAEPVIKPDAKDRRFAHPEWSTNPFFDAMKQMYLLTASWGEKLVRDAETLDPETKLKANFYVRQLASAISPSNFVLTNPELFHETLGSSADNLVRGMQMLTEDITAGKGDLKIRQSDTGEFEVGRNLAASAGKVIFENELFQLIQYAPTTETVMSIPLLVVPPWINKFYVLDLTPDKSFIKWMVDQGLTVFVISWVNPEAEHAEKSFSDYMRDGILTALKQIETVTGEKRAHTIGYCVGGTLLAVTLGYLAAKNEDRVESATLLTTQIDFTHAGELKVFVGEEQIAKVEARMREQGYLEASKMATAFNLLRANDLIWPFVVNNYLRGKKPFPFDILYWNSDSTRLPAANHAFYLRNCYLENKLSKGLMTVENTKIDLSKVNIPIYNLATREDHIAPAKSVFLGSQFFGAPVKFVLAGSGHIAGVVNSPLKPKYQYWTGDAPKGDFESWLTSAEEHIGSWWPDWLTWLSNMSGERVPAREPGGGKLAPIEDAPGRYVKVRA